jgi:hypothetical protein
MNSVIKTTNIYDFLNILSLIKSRPNMDFGGNFAFVATMHFSFSLKKNGERFTLIDQTKR